jgi:DNA-binding transcriptional ArsR family regulator
MKFERTRKAYLAAGTPFALDIMDALSVGLWKPEEISRKAGVPECRVMAVIRRLREAGLVNQDRITLTRIGVWIHAAAADMESQAERSGKRIGDGEGGGAEGVAE